MQLHPPMPATLTRSDCLGEANAISTLGINILKSPNKHGFSQRRAPLGLTENILRPFKIHFEQDLEILL